MRVKQQGGRKTLLILSALILLTLTAFAQTNRFYYDNLGRLAVVLGTNLTDAAYYDYDAVGNILAIRRQTVGPVNLFVYSPQTTSPTGTLALQGTGFSTTLAQNTVIFCGTMTAQVVSATATQLKVLVPSTATNCIITVSTPSGVATNSKSFVAQLGVVVAPSSVSLSGTFTQQFTATVYGTNDQSVTWNINGWIPVATNTAYGLVTTNGLYTASTNPPLSGFITIHARSATDTDPLKDGIATITINAPLGPVYSPTVSAQPGVPNVLGPIYSPTVSACKSPCP